MDLHYRQDGARPEIYLKREDLNHTGAHKINNCIGQALLCLRMGKKRIIAETGAGQHGVATVSFAITHAQKPQDVQDQRASCAAFFALVEDHRCSLCQILTHPQPVAASVS